MIWSIGKNVHGLYANTMPVYRGNLSVFWSWCPLQSWNHCPMNVFEKWEGIWVQLNSFCLHGLCIYFTPLHPECPSTPCLNSGRRIRPRQSRLPFEECFSSPPSWQSLPERLAYTLPGMFSWHLAHAALVGESLGESIFGFSPPRLGCKLSQALGHTSHLFVSPALSFLNVLAASKEHCQGGSVSLLV